MPKLQFAKIKIRKEPLKKKKSSIGGALDTALSDYAAKEAEDIKAEKKKKDAQTMLANLVPSKKKIAMKSKQKPKGLIKKGRGSYA